MIATAWGMRDGQKRRLSTLRQQAISIAALAQSSLSGAIVLQMSGRRSTMLSLKTWRRLHRSAPTALMVSPSASSELAVGLAISGGNAAVAGGFGLVAGEGGGWGTSLVLVPCCCARVSSTRSTLVRTAKPY